MGLAPGLRLPSCYPEPELEPLLDQGGWVDSSTILIQCSEPPSPSWAAVWFREGGGGTDELVLGSHPLGLCRKQMILSEGSLQEV